MRVPKQKKVKRTTLKKKADLLFSRLIRSQGGCIGCGSSTVQCAHIISRGYYATRWDMLNAVPLCPKEHLYFTHHPLEWQEFIEIKFPGRYELLRQKALKGPTPIYEEVISSLGTL